MTSLPELLKVLADQNRLRIIALLARRSMCVCELAHILGVTQPSVSRHLKRMRSSGLISDEQDGLWTNYSLVRDNARARVLVDLVLSWCEEDPIFKKDAVKMKGLDRSKLCVSR
jgi:ArsR family transcriptional regulator